MFKKKFFGNSGILEKKKVDSQTIVFVFVLFDDLQRFMYRTGVNIMPSSHPQIVHFNKCLRRKVT